MDTTPTHGAAVKNLEWRMRFACGAIVDGVGIVAEGLHWGGMYLGGSEWQGAIDAEGRRVAGELRRRRAREVDSLHVEAEVGDAARQLVAREGDRALAGEREAAQSLVEAHL